MRTHYGPWQPCWISNQHQKHNSGRGPSSEHFWQVWLIYVQWFQRRRFKCEKLTDGRTTDAYPWQKLTWPMARWAKKLNKNIEDTHICFTHYNFAQYFQDIIYWTQPIKTSSFCGKKISLHHFLKKKKKNRSPPHYFCRENLKNKNFFFLCGLR